MSKEAIAIVTLSMTAPGALKLQQAFEAIGHTASIVILSDGHTAAERIDEADSVIFRIGPKSLLTYRDIVLPRLKNLQHKKMLSHTLDAFDKAVQMQKLHKGSVPMPATRMIKNVSELESWLPCVLKQPAGNQGKGVFLVHDEATMMQTAQQLIDTTSYCIQQEYIHMRPASDKRLFVLGSEVVAAMRRTAKDDDFRSNIHQGGTGESYTPSSEECKIAVLATACLELPFCGVDIIDGPTGPLVLEVNPSPGFAVAEISGVAVPNMIAHYYVNGD